MMVSLSVLTLLAVMLAVVLASASVGAACTVLLLLPRILVTVAANVGAPPVPVDLRARSIVPRADPQSAMPPRRPAPRLRTPDESRPMVPAFRAFPEEFRRPEIEDPARRPTVSDRRAPARAAVRVDTAISEGVLSEEGNSPGRYRRGPPIRGGEEGPRARPAGRDRER